MQSCRKRLVISNAPWTNARLRRRELKKLKTDSKAASLLQFKGNRIQLLDLAISNLSEGNLLADQEHLQKAKSDLEKLIKLTRFADKSPASWAAVKEYERDELAENSEDEKKLRVAERRALTKIKQKSSKPCVSRFSNTPRFSSYTSPWIFCFCCISSIFCSL